MTLTKANIAQRIADDCGFMEGDAAEVLEKLIDIMKKLLATAEEIMISSFEKWHIRSKRPRRGRNPKTGHEIMLDARKVVTWKYSPVLKNAVNGIGEDLTK